MKLNKRAAIDNCVTSKDNQKYRQTHDARIPFGVSALKHNRGVSLPNEAFSYGRANRPQTPVGGIISNSFGEAASQILQTRYGNIKEFKKAQSPKGQIEVRYTNAKMKAEEFIKTKNSFDWTTGASYSNLPSSRR